MVRIIITNGLLCRRQNSLVHKYNNYNMRVYKNLILFLINYDMRLNSLFYCTVIRWFRTLFGFHNENISWSICVVSR